jgi:hypothetical protein
MMRSVHFSFILPHGPVFLLFLFICWAVGRKKKKSVQIPNFFLYLLFALAGR